jgi:hypothetical protein
VVLVVEVVEVVDVVVVAKAVVTVIGVVVVFSTGRIEVVETAVVLGAVDVSALLGALVTGNEVLVVPEVVGVVEVLDAGSTVVDGGFVVVEVSVDTGAGVVDVWASASWDELKSAIPVESATTNATVFWKPAREICCFIFETAIFLEVLFCIISLTPQSAQPSLHR